MANGSELYTGYALDGLGQAPNEDEIARCLISIGDSAAMGAEVAWMPADNTFHGEPMRSTALALKKVLAQAADMGFRFNLGIECELYVLKENEDGTLSVPNKDDKLSKSCV